MELHEFAEDFFQNILQELNTYHGNAEEIFVEKVCKHLAENGITENVQPSFWQKASQGIKVNAHSYNEGEQKLTLFIAVHEMPYEKVKTMSRTEAERAINRAIKFYKQSASNKLREFIEESNGEAYDLASLIESTAKTLNNLEIFLITNCVYKSNDIVNMTDVDGIDVTFQIWDIERLYQLVNEMQGSESFVLNFEKDFGGNFEMMKALNTNESSKDFEVYIGYVPGIILAKAYEKFGQRLIERNVRSFLQSRGTVNRGIKQTLETQKDHFIAYNNGISTTAEKAVLCKVSEGSNLYTVHALEGWQIVNGGQTTASLHHAWVTGVNIEGVNVQVKLTLLKTSDEMRVNELIAHISKYANTQNKISFSDLGANDTIHIQLEQLSRNIWAPDPSGLKSEKKWYYERARGQYIVDINRQGTTSAKEKFKKQNPKNQLVTKTQLAKYYMTWEGMPHIVSKGSEANFTDFMRLIVKNKREVDAEFYKLIIAKAIIFVTTDDIVKKMGLPGYKANVVAYTVAMVAHALGESYPLIEIWNKQAVNPTVVELIKKTAEVTWIFISNPSAQGTNISQWCKKDSCWNEFVDKYSEQVKGMVTGMYQVASTKESVAESPNVYSIDSSCVESDLITILENASLEFIDKRASGGCLWVIDTIKCAKIVKELSKQGHSFVFSSKGSKTTKNRAAWFLK
ncbi:AIPR family protein [Paenibacillus anseongense]|uniref:AIPR family protein n=1 Tax=Paenibacillus anseongense TaxID=2682845 RepID=UPI002DBB5214|nr:AIPR family protein [Paenibacillus anseongense]MEC0269705.1 AIPR family protein [Paenibacillus anseongense]